MKMLKTCWSVGPVDNLNSPAHNKNYWHLKFHSENYWPLINPIGSTNQRMGVHGSLNISEMGSGAMEE
jgi:hypothetical protein